MMDTGTEGCAKLLAYRDRCRRMPNGGALLTVSTDGVIGNGMYAIANFGKRRTAANALKRCGFVKDRQGRWRIAGRE